MRYEVKELEIGGLLDQSIRLFRDHFKFMMMVACIPFFPGVMIELLRVLSMPSIQPDASQELPPQVMMMFSPTAIILMLLTVFVTIVTTALSTGAATWGVTHRYLGHDVPARECFRIVLRRFPRLMWAIILYVPAVGLGMMLFLLPGIYLMFAWYVMYPVMIFEDLSAIRSMRRSRKLMVGHKGKAFIVGLLVGIIAIAAMLFGKIIPNVYAATALTEVITAILTVFGAVVTVVIYISARCRVEHFDLELLTQMVERGRTVEEPAL